MRQALGRGIDALISQAQESNESSKARLVQKIPVDKIHPNKFQPRQVFDETTLKELSDSIKKHGLTQPVVVSHDREKDSYELVAGERRWRATKMAGIKEIDAVIRPKLKEQEKLALSLIENIQREDLNPIDLAQAYKKLTDEFGVMQMDLAAYCGKSKSAISNSIRLLDLEPEIQNAVKKRLISEGHARTLLSLPDSSKRLRILQSIIEKKMSVRETEDEVYRPDAGVFSNNGKKGRSKKPPEILDMESRLQKLLGTRVKITPGSRPQQGSVTIYYYSLEDFDRIMVLFRK